MTVLRLSALVIVLVTAIGLYKKAWLPEKHCIRAGFFVYYTHLSNLLILLYELALGASGHDPHCGAFAVIRLCSYFAAYFALCSCVAFTPRVGVLWTLALVGERALSGLAVATFPLAKNTGLAHTFATAADRTTVRRVLMVLAALLSAALLALGGWALVLAAVCVFARYYVVAQKQFGGVTGDLAGWFLQKCEIWMLAALAACQWLGVL